MSDFRTFKKADVGMFLYSKQGEAAEAREAGGGVLCGTVRLRFCCTAGSPRAGLSRGRKVWMGCGHVSEFGCGDWVTRIVLWILPALWSPDCQELGAADKEGLSQRSPLAAFAQPCWLLIKWDAYFGNGNKTTPEQTGWWDAHCVKVLIAKSEDLGLVPSTHIVVGENWTLDVVFWQPLWQVSTCTAYISNNNFWKIYRNLQATRYKNGKN